MSDGRQLIEHQRIALKGARSLPARLQLFIVNRERRPRFVKYPVQHFFIWPALRLKCLQQGEKRAVSQIEKMAFHAPCPLNTRYPDQILLA